MTSFTSTRCVRATLALIAIVTLGIPTRTVAAQAPKPFEALSHSAESLRDSIVQMARAQVGKRYRTGGQSPERGFDCSGLVAYVMAKLNLQVPRTARLQAKEGLAVRKDTTLLLPGDLLTFGKKNQTGVSHIGIYVGNGKYVHASSVAGRVIESPIERPPSPLIKAWRGARRLLVTADTLPALNVIGQASLSASKSN